MGADGGIPAAPPVPSSRGETFTLTEALLRQAGIRVAGAGLDPRSVDPGDTFILIDQPGRTLSLRKAMDRLWTRLGALISSRYGSKEDFFRAVVRHWAAAADNRWEKAMAPFRKMDRDGINPVALQAAYRPTLPYFRATCDAARKLLRSEKGFENTCSRGDLLKDWEERQETKAP